MIVRSKYKSGFILKRVILLVLFASVGAACIGLSGQKAFKEYSAIIIGLGIAALVIMLVLLFNFLANKLASLEISDKGLEFRNGLSRKRDLIAWKDIKRFGTGKSEHFMGLTNSEGDTSVVIETHAGEQYSFSEEEYGNFKELRDAFMKVVSRK